MVEMSKKLVVKDYTRIVFWQSEEEEEDQHVRGSQCFFYSEATVMT